MLTGRNVQVEQPGHSWVVLCVLSSAALILWLYLFVVPGTPVYLIGDQSFILDNAVRMVRGQVMYRDFFRFTFPGAEFLYYVLFKAFGVHAWIPNVTLVALGVADVAIATSLSRKIIDGWPAFLPAILFLYTFYFIRDATHHKYSVLFVLAATAVLIEHRSFIRVAAAGALCALAAFFTQDCGALAALAIGVFLYWDGLRSGDHRGSILRKEAVLFGSSLLVLFVLSAYFVWNAGFNRFVDCTIVFPLRFYRQEPCNNWHAFFMNQARPIRPGFAVPWLISCLTIYALIPLIYFACLAYIFRRHDRAQQYDRLLLVDLAGLALYGSFGYAPAFIHLCEISLPALILAVWFVNSPRLTNRLALGAVGVMTSVPVFLLAVSMQVRWHGFLRPPVGSIAIIYPHTYARYAWVLQHTSPGQYFFDGDYPDLYFVFALRNPAKIPSLTMDDYTRPGQIAETLAALKGHNVQLIGWSDDLNRPGYNIEPIRWYLQTDYNPLIKFSDGYVIWGRRYPAREPPDKLLARRLAGNSLDRSANSRSN